jgi:acyl-CoA synthetase (AMP-forming)/AMP-acid ligase II
VQFHNNFLVFISKSTEFCLSDDEYLWSYSDLSQTINKIAYYLKDQFKLKHGDVVVTSIAKSNLAIAFSLGIMKAGGVFLPLDENLPFERLDFVMNDSNSRLLIDSDFVKVRVRGEFPSVGDRQFIPSEFVDNARGKHIALNQYNFAPSIIGVDPAWDGGDGADNIDAATRGEGGGETLIRLARVVSDREVTQQKAPITVEAEPVEIILFEQFDRKPGSQDAFLLKSCGTLLAFDSA